VGKELTDPTLTSLSNDQKSPSRDKRWLGFTLCVGSALATLVIVAFLAIEIVSFVEEDTFSKDTEGLENISPAAGSSKK